MVSAAKPFAELKVFELAGSIAGAYCAKLFADNGARVTTVGKSLLAQSQSAALLGQNNKSILVDLAGLSESELTELENLGVVATEPPL